MADEDKWVTWGQIDPPLDFNFSKINWNFSQQNFFQKSEMVQVVSSDDDDVVQVTRTKVKEGKKKSQVRDPRMSGLENRSRSTTQGPSLGPDFAWAPTEVEIPRRGQRAWWQGFKWQWLWRLDCASEDRFQCFSPLEALESPHYQ